jgi:3alpha(or 20beta)-hydroxysteroid dehydrogenase
MSRFDGHRALVTGGASGIGEATSRMLIAEGASVVITDVNDELGASLAEEIGAEYSHLEVSDSSQWAELTASHDFTIGVLNAGVGARFDDLRNVSDEVFERVMDVNVGGVFYGTRELFRSMAGRGGSISVTASIAGIAAHTQSPIYGASKSAVIGWIRAIAPSLDAEGVRINAVCPGLVDTPILGPGGGDMMRQMGMKVLDASEVAAAHATSLLHDETGTIFTVQAGVPVGIHVFDPIAGYQG